jgi:hypothetical protein
LVGVTAILKEAWNTSKQDDIGTKEKLSALALAKECYSMKLDLLANATVVSDAMRFVSANYNNNRSDNEGQKHISNHQAKEEEEQQPEPTTITTIAKEENTTATTTNQVF